MIYLCIPARDEARTLGVLLWKVRRVMREFGRDYEVHVLDDGSRDDTAEVLERYRRVLPLRIARNPEPVGYGAALEQLVRTAVEAAPYPKRDVVVTLQGDFSESPEQIVDLVKTIEGGADLVAGVEDPASARPRPIRLARWAAPFLLGRVLRGAPVSDPLCGFRAYRVVVLKKALRALNGGPMVRSDGWAANLEMLRSVAPHARRIEERPTRVRYDLRARPTRVRTLRALRELVGLRGTGWVEAVREEAT